MGAGLQELGVALTVIAGILGLLVGSFLNVVIYRVPLGKSIVSPPSSCTNCGVRIRATDNIPVLSWLFLRGRCRNCGDRISPRYPLVELLTGALFVAIALRFPIPLDAPTMFIFATVLVQIAYLYFTAVAIALALIDLDTHRLPNAIVFPSYGVIAALFLGAFVLSGDFSQLVQTVVGGAALFALYFVLALVYPGGMGFGDVKLAGVVGMVLGFLGWGALIVGAFAAFLLGGAFGVALLVLRRADRKSGIPFGPWMLVAAFISIFIGERVWNGYLGLFHLA